MPKGTGTLDTASQLWEPPAEEVAQTPTQLVGKGYELKYRPVFFMLTQATFTKMCAATNWTSGRRKLPPSDHPDNFCGNFQESGAFLGASRAPVQGKPYRCEEVAARRVRIPR